MSESSTSCRSTSLGLLFLCLVPAAGSSLLRGQEKPSANPPAPERSYPRSESCRRCHDHLEQTDGQLPFVCDAEDMKKWDSQPNKHKEAFASLKSERALRMAERLQLSDLTKEAACVNCHSVPHDAKPDELDEGFDREKEGVTCVVCHGARKDWISKHHGDYQTRSRKEWRALTRHEREQKHGMIDLWDPERRAAVCLSCHLGNADEGKIITHEMYAAGHPPLPSFELANFSRASPQHWKLLRDKSPMVRKGLRVEEDEIQFEETRLVVAGAAGSVRETMRLLNQMTAETGRTTVWPELAQFDCLACHHDLESSGWRQSAERPGTAGRPGLREWPTVFARAALRASGDDAATFDKGFASLRRAFDLQPFGRPEEIHAASKAGMNLPARPRHVNEHAALTLLHELCGTAERDLPDYDTARQLFWSLRIVAGELRPPLNPAIFKPLEEQLSASSLALPLDRLYAYDPKQVREKFKTLRSVLPKR